MLAKQSHGPRSQVSRSLRAAVPDTLTFFLLGVKPMGYMTLPASKMPPPVTEFAHDLPHLSCVSISPCHINSKPQPSRWCHTTNRLALGDQCTLEHACPSPLYTSGRRCIECYQLATQDPVGRAGRGWGIWVLWMEVYRFSFGKPPPLLHTGQGSPQSSHLGSVIL